jgi:hypothetical protein
MGPFVGNTAGFARSALETGLSVARTKTDSLLLPHCSLECLFNAGNFALEAPRMAFSVVDFDRTGNTVAILLHPLITFLHYRKDLLPFTF